MRFRISSLVCLSLACCLSLPLNQVVASESLQDLLEDLSPINQVSTNLLKINYVQKIINESCLKTNSMSAMRLADVFHDSELFYLFINELP